MNAQRWSAFAIDKSFRPFLYVFIATPFNPSYFQTDNSHEDTVIRILKRIQTITQAMIFVILAMLPVLSNAQEKSFPVLRGAYFGLQPPGAEPVVFAKGIVSTELYEHSAPAFSPDGRTVLWTVVDRGKPSRLLEMNIQGDRWTEPHLPSFADSTHDDFYPFFSTDGKKLLFCSRRALPSGEPVGDIRLWVVGHSEKGWDEPAPLDTIVSKGLEYAHSVSARGNLFFSAREILNGKPTWKIYTADFINGHYSEPRPLDSSVNTGAYVDGPFISKNEDFLIFESDRPGGLGSIDLYICFKEKNGEWGAPKNMGEKINSSAAERFAGISPDGKYLFFGSNRSSELPDVYWIDARVIDNLK